MKMKSVRKIMFIPAIALAPPVLATTPTGITFDCDTAASHFSELVIPAPTGAFKVSGELQINQIPAFDKWSPTANLRIAEAPTAPGAPSAWSAGFKLSAIPAKMIDSKVTDDKLAIQFLEWGQTVGGDEKDNKPFGFAKMGEELPFTLAYDGAHVTINIGGKSTELALTTSNPVVKISCSTGEFLFTNLKIEKQP